MHEHENEIIAKTLAETSDEELREGLKELLAFRAKGQLVNGVVRMLANRVGLRADIPTHIAKKIVTEHLLFTAAKNWLGDDAEAKSAKRRARQPAAATSTAH